MCVWPIFQKLSGRQFSLWPWLALTYLSFLSGVRRDQNSWKFAFWRRFWHGAVEHCSMVLHWSSGARHLRKFACGPAVSRSATNFRNIRAPQHRANGVCNLCLGEPPVITTVFSAKGCFKQTISLPIRHMPRTNWWPKSDFSFLTFFFWQNGCPIAPSWIFERLLGHFYTSAEST